MLNSHLSFKISLPFHTKATTSDLPRHPLFTPRHFQVERENLSIYLGFPGTRQSRARAASDTRLASLEAQKEHSEQLHVQGVLCRDQHIPAVMQLCSRQVRAVQPLECAGQTATALMDTQPGHTGLCCLCIHSLCGVKYRSYRYTELGGDNDTRNVPKYVSICSQSSSNILHYISN